MSDGVDGNFLEGDVYEIMVSRNNIFGSMVDELSASVYDPRLPLKVEFMGERGSDLGGPRKEFLRLALREVYDRLTSGPATQRALVSEADMDATYLRRKVFYVAGIVIGEFSLCIIGRALIVQFTFSLKFKRINVYHVILGLLNNLNT